MQSEVDELVAGIEQTGLYDPDAELLEYVSSVGSSVSHTKKNTMEVDAEMLGNAMAMITSLNQKVIKYIAVLYFDIN